MSSTFSKHEPETMDDNGHNKTSSSSNVSDHDVITNSEFYGHPVQIVKVTDERKFELDVEALGNILLQDSICDTPVVVVSIAGDYRKGKSFMLNHFLQYLQAGCGTVNWLADPNAPLKGFSWRGDSVRDTTGILMWSEPFVIKLDDGTNVAVLLMDTQGAFDSNDTMKETATVFALSIMISSMQVFNLMTNLQENDLQVLEVFLEYGRLALESVHEKPFQKLIFLIRDWSFKDYKHGFEGGARLLEKKLEIKDTMPEELQRVRRKIKQCFCETGCFLMPHPGDRVATNLDFEGQTAHYKADFLSNLKIFVPDLLAPKKLILKKIGGRYVTGCELLEYFKVYINVFAGNTIPEPKSMLEATAGVNNLTAVNYIKKVYMVKMEKICGGSQPFINPAHLVAKNGKLVASCMDHFDKIPKLGGAEFSASHRKNLEEDLNTSFKHFANQNRSKSVFGFAFTPVIMFFAAFIFYLLDIFFLNLGMKSMSNFFYVLWMLNLIGGVAYFYIRKNGNCPKFITLLDKYGENIWLFVVTTSKTAFCRVFNLNIV